MCDGPCYCTSAVAPQVSCGGIWPFGDLMTGAHQLALVLVPCQAAEPTPTNLRPPEHGSMARTGAPGAPRGRHVGGFGRKLWALAVSHHRLRRSPPPWSYQLRQWGSYSVEPRSMCSRWNRSPFLSAGIRVQLVGRCAMVSSWTW
jgi:hypothetical protein